MPAVALCYETALEPFRPSGRGLLRWDDLAHVGYVGLSDEECIAFL